MNKIEKIYSEINKLNIDNKSLNYIIEKYVKSFDFLNKKFLDAYVKNEVILSNILLKIMYISFKNNYDKRYIAKIIENNLYGFFYDENILLDVKLKLNKLVQRFLGFSVRFNKFFIINEIKLKEQFDNYFDYIFYSSAFKLDNNLFFKKSFTISYLNDLIDIKKNILISFLPTKLIKNNKEDVVNLNLKFVYFDNFKLSNILFSTLIYNNENNYKLKCYYMDYEKDIEKVDLIYFSPKFVFADNLSIDKIFKVKKYFTTGCNKCFYTKNLYKGKYKNYTQMAIVGGKEKPIIFPYDIDLRWKKVYKFVDENELKSFATPAYKKLLKYKDKLAKRNLNSNFWFEYNNVKLDLFLKPMIIISYKIRKKENLDIRLLNGYDTNKKFFYIPIGYSMIIANDEISSYYIKKIDLGKIKEIILKEYLYKDNQGYYRFNVDKFKKNVYLKDIIKK